MLRFLAVVFASAFLSLGFAHAASETVTSVATVSELLQQCKPVVELEPDHPDGLTADEMLDAMLCTGIVIGIQHDMLVTDRLCYDSGTVGPTEIILKFIEFAEANPKMSGEDGIVTMIFVTQATWPCNTDNAPSE